MACKQINEMLGSSYTLEEIATWDEERIMRVQQAINAWAVYGHMMGSN